MKNIAIIVCAAFIIFFIKVGVLGGGIEGSLRQIVTVPESLTEHNAVILFAGDMMFDRTIRAKNESTGYDSTFSCMSDYLKGLDLVVANLEGPITPYSSLSSGTKPGEGNNTTFTFSPLVAGALARNNVRMVNLGNNHMFDFGREGASSTRAYLAQNHVGYFGSPESSIIATTTLNGFRLAFINYNQFLGVTVPQDTVDAIRNVRAQSDYIFVYTHWGEEYVMARDYEKDLAREFIDAGADMVIGSHPHVIQEHEMYKGKHVFYSLGNFVFDQYFSNEVKVGGGVEVHMTPRGIDVQERRFNLLRTGQTCLG